MAEEAADSGRSDTDIVRSVLGGDRQSYAELVRRYQGRLRSFLSYYCRTREEVEEFVQNAFVQGYTHLRQYQPGLPWFPWLKTIALNALRMEIRRKANQKEAPGEYFRRIQLAQVDADPDGKGAEVRGEALKQCLKKLPKQQAELLIAKYQREIPLSTLSRTQNASVGALKVRLLRLRQALKQCIDRQIVMAERF